MVKKNIYIKRIIDIIIAMMGLFFLSPLILILTILIKNRMGSPVFFIQKRIGKNNKEFNLIKFRTMKDLRDEEGELLPEEKRRSRLGNKLRELSLDEIPELINILKGDMSLVGPRPLLVDYLPLYNEEEIRRHDVLPGLTGWAQINGRNNTTWKKRFQLDLWYVDNWSIFLDFKIIFLTFFKVIKKEGVDQSGEVTMQRFTGSN
ncbi:sugar transferase [Clostridium sp. B9]|uniref:sugar transferase n=1 Tax=Clostridium sp. B9 TaxID=3423224 RepID=UPI003D2EE542